MNKIIFINICLILFAYISPAQTPKFRHYTVKDGLPSSEVYHTIQDKKGYIWFATDNGASRFNGNEFVNFNTEDGLKNNTIFTLFEDHQDRIWMLSYNAQLCYYKNGKITEYKHNNKISEFFADHRIIFKSSFYVDTNNTIYIGTMDSGIVTIDNQGNIRQIKETGKFNIVIVENKALFGKEGWGAPPKVFVKHGKKKYTCNTGFKDPATPWVYAVLTNQDNILFATKKTILTLKKDSVLRTVYKHSIVNLVESECGDIWVCTQGNGVFCYTNDDLSQQPEHYLNGLPVTYVLVDHDGGTWFTTLKGVYYASNINIKTYTIEDGLTNNRIQCLHYNKPNLWAGTYDNYIHKITNKVQKSYKLSENTNYIPYELYYDNNENTLFFTGNKISGQIYNDKVNLLNNLYHQEHKRFYQTDETTYQSFIKGKNFILGVGMGAALIDYKKKRTSTIIPVSKLKLYTIIKTGNEKYLVGGQTGLYELFKNKLRNLGDSIPLLKTRINDIKQDKYKNIWLATKGYGIFILNNDSVRIINKETGLSDNAVNSLYVYGDEIWAGTRNGLNKIDFDVKLESFEIQTYSKFHGLESNEINEVIIADSVAYIATNVGLSFFNISDASLNKNPPPVYIKTVSIAESDTIVLENYTLNHKQNAINICYQGISYKNARNIIYKYRLNKNDITENWTYTKNNNVRFTFLPAGNYQFEVCASNEDGTWSVQPESVNFVITPPFWKTWWFISIIILATLLIIGSIVLSIYLIKLKEYKKQHRLKEELIHYRQQALNKQINPHFIFNSLNSIQRYIFENDKIKSNEYLSMFSSLMRTIFDNSRKNLISIQEELTAVSLYLDLEKIRFKNCFNYQITIEDDSIYKCKIPPLLLQPFVENSIWHGLMHNKNIQGLISLHLWKEKNYLVCRIIDNGIGINQSRKLKNQKHESAGTSLTNDRIKVINSLYNLNMSIHFQDLKNEGSQGTKVEFKFPVIN